jgi:integrase
MSHHRGGRRSKGAQLYLRDAKRPGGARRWVILDTKANGQRIERSTGALESDRAAAEKAYAEYLAAKHVPDFGAGRPDQALIADVLAYYGEAKTGKVSRNDTLALGLVKLGEFWASLTVHDITKERCEAYVDWRINLGDARGSNKWSKRVGNLPRRLKPTTARNDLIILQAAIRYCFENRKLTQIVPVPKPPAPSPEDQHPRMLDRSEAARLLAAALGWDMDGRRHPRRINRHVARFILTGLYTGTRHDRILRLQWIENMQGGWVDLDKGMLNRRAANEPLTMTKKRAPNVPLPDRLAVHMRRWRGLSNRHVIEHQGSNIQSIEVGFEAAARLAGLWSDDPAKNVTPHTLRHTCVSWMLEAGKTPFQVGKYVGMTAGMVERVYGHVTNDQQRATANAISRRNGPGPSHTRPTQLRQKA